MPKRKVRDRDGERNVTIPMKPERLEQLDSLKDDLRPTRAAVVADMIEERVAKKAGAAS